MSIDVPFLSAHGLVALALSVSLGSAAAQPPAPTTTRVEFRDVLPVLKAHCLQCHGPVRSEGGLRLDGRPFALSGGASGPAVVPGSAAKSLLIARVTGAGGKPRMPLGFAPLPPVQIAVLRAWIDEGAPWPDAVAARKHWAYVKPTRPKVPSVRDHAWVRNPIDAFVLARLEREGLNPSPETDRTTLVRRVTLDLTGLPPTPSEVDAFLADRKPGAYERVVDRLLASPHYGERMALPWLDAARYADSNGFQQDGDTYQYVWRDWVVKALNANMPFDRFTILQLAGDLLPNATLDDKIATGFNRCHLLNGEGGAIPEEQRNVILFDRVDVTATTWLGATLACAQCHNHKYDPYTQRDYYRFMAFFNNVPESGVPPGGGQYRIADPWVYAPNEQESKRLDALRAEIADAKSAADRAANAPEVDVAQRAWEAAARAQASAHITLGPWSMMGPFAASTFDTAYDTEFVPPHAGQYEPLSMVLSPKLRWTPVKDLKDGEPYPLTGENSAFYFYRTVTTDRDVPLQLSLGSDDAIKVWLNGNLVLADKLQRAVAPDQEKPTIELARGTNHLLIEIVNGGGIGGIYFRALSSGPPTEVAAIVAKDAAVRTPAEAARLRAYFLETAPPAAVKGARERAAAAQKALDDYKTTVPRVMVMSDAMPRKTHMLMRGNYLTPGDEVPAGTPAFLPPMPAGQPDNRLGLAEWLVSPDNPLTARVQVNRYWQLFFGTGLVKTSENLGTQCDPPANQVLLDWLACEFMRPELSHEDAKTRSGHEGNAKLANGAAPVGIPDTQHPTPDSKHRTPNTEHHEGPTTPRAWDIKHLVRLIVTSATYRQSSRCTPAMLERDPENRLLARGARFRLPSMLLRDVALASSGLLDPRIGGKPVYPYQPKGIWDGLAITNERDFTYPQSHGADLYRRSIYTFWRRTVAPADMFDASMRQTCKVRLPITCTPLHALTTLNDVTWVEAGRTLAQHVMKEAGPSDDARLTEAFRRVCARRPAPAELAVLQRCLNRARAAFRARPASAAAYLKAGESPRDASLDPVEHAAFAVACLAIYNLDEALTRE